MADRQVATELGVNEQNQPKWKQKFKELPAGHVTNTLEALQAENQRLQRELHRVPRLWDILKNLGYNLRTARHRFERIKAMQAEYPIANLRVTLNVTRSGYHVCIHRAPSDQAQAHRSCVRQVQQIGFRSWYGHEVN